MVRFTIKQRYNHKHHLCSNKQMLRFALPRPEMTRPPHLNHLLR